MLSHPLDPPPRRDTHLRSTKATAAAARRRVGRGFFAFEKILFLSLAHTRLWFSCPSVRTHTVKVKFESNFEVVVQTIQRQRRRRVAFCPFECVCVYYME